ncbi:Iron sulfur cluster assembly protein 1, mitochondrial [Fulvia fulva]|uniref:Iron-sulfur cluster assembly protein n=1 Tax=Passalora fulva TaxID=5499 RepID=A0A9Q8PH17_PASFU|nr:Iron sulfur cluster assembly protein 1, mitochondrial [Fulvia fulva]KAK4613645.1 Iron sulfur cluster assembly protein 1, mitochondrial [Fulvia fulva]KAK4614426.1 Iron sulfur cluster assembly protein 1, mitochondrial [Fulvia fulva]UJO22280.1 Iron sulfur cluster assembly protein 1, mitochondrial [Fulvia fulva]WPV20182.1 Iron sulfur cluster assembly protein 1, mitochondrial [Fulvia fulva]WPV35495.1 Iron sulfur cluster assembly protein 1, mitochondrial [Fulvia fulva]
MFKRVLATAPAQASAAVRHAATSSARPQFASTITKATLSTPVRRSYHEKVLDHYNNPRNVGSMKKDDVDVGTGLVGAPACGDVMKLQIKVGKNADGEDMIDEVKFKTFGCGSAIASSSYLTELVRGMTLEEAGRIRNTEIAKELCLPPVKLHCSMLAEDAIKSAISNYYTKNPKARATDLGGTGAAMPKIEIEKIGSNDNVQPSL